MKTLTQALKLGGGGGMKTPVARRRPALKTLTALTLIAALAALVLYAAIPAGAQTFTDYDTDDDGLIDIRNVEQLREGTRFNSGSDGVPIADRVTQYNAAFPNRDTSTAGLMGCPGGVCRGYELMADINFDSDGDGNSDTPWPNTNRVYTSIFEGNGHTISNLSVNLATAGLFRTIHTTGVVRNVGLINPTVTAIASSGSTAGALAATNNGTIIASYVQGGTVRTERRNGFAGGLVGASWSADSSIVASWSTASVSASGATSASVGGLLGRQQAGTVIASYAAGSVSFTGSTPHIGGVVGRSTGGTVVDSYCSDATGRPGCIPAAEMQATTGYTGIYANWNVDLGNIDDDAFPDYPWNFGTTSTYPVLNTAAQRQAAAAVVVDYDRDNDNLIDIASLQQLNAIRHDSDGSGLPQSAAGYPGYVGAFPNGNIADTGTPYMGCAAACLGYELTANLDFAADGVAVTSTDAYPNWTPIGGDYAAVFDGKGFTISNLTISGSVHTSTGLFGELAAAAKIRDLGMIDPAITHAGAADYVGVIAGDNGGAITASYVQGGAVTVTGTSTYGGGLVGRNSGDVRAVYATASVTASSTASSTVGGLIGLHSGSISAAYAAGAVTGTPAAIAGGFVGEASSTAAAIAAGYCDTGATGQSACIGAQSGGAGVTAEGKTAAELRAPTGYTGIYASWNIDLDGDNIPDYPWNFGTSGQYPMLNSPDEREASRDTLPPGLPRSIPPEPERAYDPAADHPEIYANDEYGMAATCQTHDVDPETGNPRAATVTFDLGSYDGPILLHLSIWRNGRYMAYETQGIALPGLERDGPRAWVRVVTDPGETRFRLDGRRHGLAANLVLGYADCRRDDP